MWQSRLSTFWPISNLLILPLDLMNLSFTLGIVYHYYESLHNENTIIPWTEISSWGSYMNNAIKWEVHHAMWQSRWSMGSISWPIYDLRSNKYITFHLHLHPRMPLHTMFHVSFLELYASSSILDQFVLLPPSSQLIDGLEFEVIF
mgnify:CR=1 FL=1